MAKAEQYEAELIERRDVSTSLAVFRFRSAEQPTFTAGQFATIGVAINGNVIERPYSIVSSPFEPFLEFCNVCTNHQPAMAGTGLEGRNRTCRGYRAQTR